uniref:Uncharacterized protein n=1 Tax=Ditylenchus dipsaci TaxID=166011 RepID=A0A915DZI1_9BILA
MFTITTFPNYPSPTNTEQLDRSQKNSPTNNPHSEPEMAKDGENSLSTVLKVKSAESQAHIQSEPVAEKRGDHGQTHSQAAIDPKSYIPMAETGAAKPKIHAEINPTRTLDQKAGEEHKTAHQSEADTCKPRPLEENRLKFSRHESKISADSDPQSNHPESEPKEQATKQVAGQHLATTVDRDHAAHPLTVDMAEPKAVQEKLHELAKPALPELSQPIEELEKILRWTPIPAT